jgi:hypothetical protein
VQKNVHLIAMIGSRVHLKVEKYLRERLEQAKVEVLTGQERAIKDLQVQIDQLQRQQQQYSNSNKEQGNHDQEEYPAKRHKRSAQEDSSVCSLTDDCVAACEVKIAALGAMVMNENDTATKTFNLDAGVKIKIEEPSWDEEEESFETANTSTPPASSKAKDDDNDAVASLMAAKEQELQDVRAELKTTQHELQGVRAELEASQKTVKNYHEKCQMYKENKLQLHKVTASAGGGAVKHA